MGSGGVEQHSQHFLGQYSNKEIDLLNTGEEHNQISDINS